MPVARRWLWLCSSLADSLAAAEVRSGSRETRAAAEARGTRGDATGETRDQKASVCLREERGERVMFSRKPSSGLFAGGALIVSTCSLILSFACALSRCIHTRLRAHTRSHTLRRRQSTGRAEQRQRPQQRAYRRVQVRPVCLAANLFPATAAAAARLQRQARAAERDGGGATTEWTTFSLLLRLLLLRR